MGVATTSRAVEAVLVAIDLSDASRAAVERAAGIAARHGARLYVVHVVPEENLVLPGVAILESRLAELFELAESRAMPRASVVECVRLGRPACEIGELAREKNVDLIVTGTHSGAAVTSSVAGEIVRTADRPVLVVRETAHGPGPAKRLLAAIDYGAGSKEAVLAALPIMAPDGEVDLVHVIPDDVARSASALAVVDAVDVREAMISVARTNLTRWIEENLPSPRPRTRALVCVGNAGVLLGDLAVGGGYDLVACGTHGRSGLRRAMLGSVAEALVHASLAPVLIVRERAT